MVFALQSDGELASRSVNWRSYPALKRQVMSSGRTIFND